MTLTYYLLQIPPYLLFILMISYGAIVAGLATFLFRKYKSLRILRSHNEVTGFFFLAIAGFYSLLLSFTVFVVWDQLNDIQANVSKEGSSAMALYRDIKFYPDTTESKQLNVVYLEFVLNVLHEEFPNMELMKPSRKTSESFSRVFYKMERLNPKNQFQIQLVGKMFGHLNELATYRGLRTSSIGTEIPSPMWFPIILGAIILIACTVLLDIEHTSMHVGLTALLGAYISMFLFIIIILGHPYIGELAIKPISYNQIFTVEKWANEHINTIE